MLFGLLRRALRVFRRRDYDANTTRLRRGLFREDAITTRFALQCATVRELALRVRDIMRARQQTELCCQSTSERQCHRFPSMSNSGKTAGTRADHPVVAERGIGHTGAEASRTNHRLHGEQRKHPDILRHLRHQKRARLQRDASDGGQPVTARPCRPSRHLDGTRGKTSRSHTGKNTARRSCRVRLHRHPRQPAHARRIRPRIRRRRGGRGVCEAASRIPDTDPRGQLRARLGGGVPRRQWP